MKQLENQETGSSQNPQNNQNEKRHTYLLRGIPDDLWRKAKAYAGRNGTTVREIILTALREVTK